jgi:hypothetical protein
MIGDVRRQMRLVERLGDWMGTGGRLPLDGAARGWLPSPMAAERNPAPSSALPRYRRRASHPISVPAASVAGRALRVPSGSACGRPFPRPSPAGSGGLWEAQGSYGRRRSVSGWVPCGAGSSLQGAVVPTEDRQAVTAGPGPACLRRRLHGRSRRELEASRGGSRRLPSAKAPALTCIVSSETRTARPRGHVRLRVQGSGLGPGD